ncbi:MAG TPA: AAA family ATPase [Streptosporangiaceae bacterium]|nr:AAA family ATPase [Streptosporangiaceae bacterium]
MLRVALLGEQAVTDDRTGSVRRPSARAIALVAFLAGRAGVPQPRQRIAGLFWPDSADGQALTNLRRELHHLRQVLDGDPALVITPRDLCWQDTPGCRVDLRVFAAEGAAAQAAAQAGDSAAVVAHATRAIAEYRGDLLPGIYDEWLAEARSDLERQCADLCDLICAAHHGDLAVAVDAARRRVRLQPLEETGYRTLMRLQAELGDRAGAVSTYHRCASVLERELGVQPDPATRQAFRQLMDGEAARPPGLTGPAGDAGPPGRSRPALARLTGRAGDLRRLLELWQQAAAGQPGLAVVRGSAGVGKTRLVAEVAALARQRGVLVASTQCFGTPGLALAPVADWLRTPAIQAAVGTLDPAWQAEVRRLVPGPGGRGASSRALVDAWQRHRFFEGLARALLAVGQPLLLVLDNLQWSDTETLEFLSLCLGLAGASPLMVAATLRDDYPGTDPALAEWLLQMRAAGLLTELPLGPLETADTAALARALSGRRLTAAQASLLQVTTGGFPLYIIEALRSNADLSADPPDIADVAAVLRKRLDQATPAARDIAGLAAAAGTSFSLDLLTEASDHDADVVVGAVDELWHRRIMRELEDDYDFTHDLLREAAYSGVSPPRRWLLHRRLAQSLELLHAGRTDAVAARLAEQYARAGRPGRALDYYRRAADVAAGMLAHADAVRLHRQALAIVAKMPPGRDTDRRELAILQALAAPLNARLGYASAELQDVLERALTLAERLGAAEAKVAGLLALWTSRFVQGRTADSYQTAAAARSLVEPGSELAGPAHFAVGGSAISLGRLAEGLRELQAAAALSTTASLQVGTRPDVHGLAWSAHAHWLLGRDDQAVTAAGQAIELARASDHPYSLTVALAYGAITQHMRRDLPALRAAVAELSELCGRYQFAYYREWALVLAGWCAADGTGAELARRGIANLRHGGAAARMPYWLSLQADIAWRDGQRDLARATLDAAIAASRACDDVWWLPEVLRMRAAHEDGPAAVARLRAAVAAAAGQGATGLLRRCQADLDQATR